MVMAVAVWGELRAVKAGSGLWLVATRSNSAPTLHAAEEVGGSKVAANSGGGETGLSGVYMEGDGTCPSNEASVSGRNGGVLCPPGDFVECCPTGEDGIIAPRCDLVANASAISVSTRSPRNDCALASLGSDPNRAASTRGD